MDLFLFRKWLSLCRSARLSPLPLFAFHFLAHCHLVHSGTAPHLPPSIFSPAPRPDPRNSPSKRVERRSQLSRRHGAKGFRQSGLRAGRKRRERLSKKSGEKTQRALKKTALRRFSLAKRHALPSKRVVGRYRRVAHVLGDRSVAVGAVGAGEVENFSPRTRRTRDAAR